MDFPLTITHLVARARALFPQSRVTARRADRALQHATQTSTGKFLESKLRELHGECLLEK